MTKRGNKSEEREKEGREDVTRVTSSRCVHVLQPSTLRWATSRGTLPATIFHRPLFSHRLVDGRPLSVPSRLGRKVVRNDDAQDHAAEEKSDEDPSHHGATMLLLRATLAHLRLRIARFAVDVRLWTEHARYRLRNTFWLRGCRARRAVGVRIVLDVVILRDGSVLL
jgi:hypothetical protein